MIAFNDLTCRRDGVVLFDEVNLVLHAGQRIALTGANGSGKSSLFAMILGSLEPDVGAVQVPRDLRLSHVAQETPATDRSALDHVIDGHQELRRIEQALAETEGLKHAALLADYEQAGGYRSEADAGTLLHGLGFSTEQHQWAVKRFSGGWRMRLNLAQALMAPGDCLLLDEPTNHLDLDAVIWLEHFLAQRDGTLLLISHDRDFLDATTANTLNIEHQKITLHTGNYSAFEAARASRLATQQAAFTRQQARIGELTRFVDRFRAKATKARQAQSRLKMLERMTRIAPAHIDSPFEFGFQDAKSLPSPLIVLQQAQVGYGDNIILDKVSLSLQPGDRIGLLGANGAGKSTLIRALTGELAVLSGTVTPARQLHVGYFAQHQVDQLRADHSALAALLAEAPELSDEQARKFLGGFGFQGDRALRPAATLSGGERARLALALIVYRRPNLLLLDEPTNHLDIDMRRALGEALQGFGGALLVISHDRSLLNSVADQCWLLADGSLSPYEGDLEDYARWLLARRRQGVGEQAALTANPASAGEGVSHSPAQGANDDHTNRKMRKQQAASVRQLLQPFRKAVEQSDKRVAKLTDEVVKMRERLADAELYNQERKAELATLLQEEASLQQQLAASEEELLDAMEALQNAEAAHLPR